jgi:hypothetical protein
MIDGDWSSSNNREGAGKDGHDRGLAMAMAMARIELRTEEDVHVKKTKKQKEKQIEKRILFFNLFL